MSLSGYFEINVALRGKHLFATDPRSIKSERDLRLIVDIFKKKFPATEGYEIMITEWQTQGRPIGPETV